MGGMAMDPYGSFAQVVLVGNGMCCKGVMVGHPSYRLHVI